MKRLLVLFVSLACLLVLGGCASLGGGEATPTEAPAASTPMVEVTAGSLNVRAEPSTSGAIVGSLKRGALVGAPQTESDGWLYVEGSDGVTGYVSSRYVRAVDAVPGTTTSRPAEPKTRPPAAGTKLARIENGMSEQQVIDILGEPTSRQSYMTGKAWIPYYYGSDTGRLDFKYKGVGRVVFARNRYSGSTTVIRVDSDSSEDGH